MQGYSSPVPYHMEIVQASQEPGLAEIAQLFCFGDIGKWCFLNNKIGIAYSFIKIVPGISDATNIGIIQALVSIHGRETSSSIHVLGVYFMLQCIEATKRR